MTKVPPRDPAADESMEDPEESTDAPLMPESDLAAMVRDLDPEVLNLPPVVGPDDDAEAPRLPLSETEPAAVSAVDRRLLEPDLALLRGRRSVDGRRQALEAALQGQAYDPMALPEPRVLFIGLMRALVESGVSPETLVQAVLDADA